MELQFFIKIHELTQGKGTIVEALVELTTKKIDWLQRIHSHVILMSNLIVKLKTMGIDYEDKNDGQSRYNFHRLIKATYNGHKCERVFPCIDITFICSPKK